MIENALTSLGTTFLTIIFNIAYTIIKIIVAPIDLIISRFLPDVNLMITYISNFLDYGFSSIGWIIDFLAIPKFCIEIIIAYYTIKYTIYFSIYLFKIIARWIKK